MIATVLPPGARERGPAGPAVLASLGVAAAFGAVTWWSKETPALDAGQPWQDDPYDVLVSLDFAVLPFLLLMVAWRVLLCRRYAVLPARRLLDVLRACSLLIGACILTQAGEWVALALQLHRSQWGPLTGVQVAALLVLTAAAAVTGVRLLRVTRSVTRVATAADSPDWMADLVTLGLLAARRLGRGGRLLQRTVRVVDQQVCARARRRPIAAAALLAGTLASPFTAAKIVLEGYPPLLVVLSFVLPAAVLFAFVVLAGRALRLVTPTWSSAPRWLPVLVVACITGPVAFAFHDSIPAARTQLALDLLLLGGGVAGAGLTAVVQLIALRSRTGRG